MCKLWKLSYGTYASRSHRRIRQLRKSERLRLAELEIIRLNYEIEYVKAMLSALIEVGGLKAPEMDAGKWYSSKRQRPDIPNN